MLPLHWKTTASFVRKCLVKTYDRLKKKVGDQYATISQWMKASKKTQPGEYESSGGFLLEYWFYSSGPHTLRKRVVAYMRRNGLRTWNENVNHLVVKECGSVWMFWMLKGTHDVSQKNSHQVLYLSLVLQYKGLSNSGLDILARGGVVLGNKTFKKKMKTISEQEQQKAE
jgi:hypothetical protein